MIISNFFYDGISSYNFYETDIEKERVRQKYFCIVQRYKFDDKFKEKFLAQLKHYKMIITHPRYIAGWIKRKRKRKIKLK